MSATFLERNKKKGAAAGLLMFLRERRIPFALLLLVLGATTVFLSSSASKWGLTSGGVRSYGDLLAAFRAARKDARGGGVGARLGAILGRGRVSGGGSPAAGDSVDLVKGGKADLERAARASAGGRTQSVAGIVDPADPGSKGSGGVAISQADLGGEREGFVKGAFAGGFLHGLFGGTVSDDRALSGGAYATRGFFSGVGGAYGTSGGPASAALGSLPPLATPSGKRAAPAKGRLSAMASRGVETRAMKGGLGMVTNCTGPGCAFPQLAAGSARAQLGATYCKAPDCPAEYAATNTGAIYDGNAIFAGFLTSSDPGASAAGLVNSTVNVPPDSAGGSSSDAQNVATCAALVQQCIQGKSAPMRAAGADENQLQAWFSQMGSACGDPCNCGPCNTLQTQIVNLCNGDLAAQMAAADAPCPPLPDYCGPLGFSRPGSDSQGAVAQNYCQQNLGQCGCNGFLCSAACALGL